MSSKEARAFVNQDGAANSGRPKVQFLLRAFRRAQLARHPFDRPSTLSARIHGGWYLLVSDVLLGVEIPVMTEIGEGFRIQHTAGIVVNGRARLGRNVTLLQGATIGVLDGSRPGTPVLGDGVEVCSHAVIAGAIKVGNGAFIGANSVVTRDVPELAVVTGNPGTVRRFRDSSEVNV